MLIRTITNVIRLQILGEGTTRVSTTDFIRQGYILKHVQRGPHHRMQLSGYHRRFKFNMSTRLRRQFCSEHGGKGTTMLIQPFQFRSIRRLKRSNLFTGSLRALPCNFLTIRPLIQVNVSSIMHRGNATTIRLCAIRGLIPIIKILTCNMSRGIGHTTMSIQYERPINLR